MTAFQNDRDFRDLKTDAGKSLQESNMDGAEEPTGEKGVLSVDLSVGMHHKDTVFRMLFNDKKELLSLYNACNKTDYTDPDELDIITLENAIYLKVRNDIGFIFDFRMNLYEHQSTWPLNIPIRFLEYIVEEMKVLFSGSRQNLYSSSKKICFPEPKCLVFYNGKGMEEDEVELLLSSHFYRKTDDPGLELKVRVLNINPGRNPEIMDACETLLGYTVFIARIRENLKDMPIGEAVAAAIDSCIGDGILVGFLKRHRKEVVGMSIFEYNEAEHLECVKEEGREEGRSELLTELVRKKLRRGNTVAQIADFLEEDECVIKEIVNKVKQAEAAAESGAL